MHANVFALLIQHGSKMTLSTVAPLYEHKTPKHKKRPCSLYGWLTRLILRQNKKQGNKEKTTTKHTSQQRLLFINSLRNISQRKCMNHFLTLNSKLIWLKLRDILENVLVARFHANYNEQRLKQSSFKNDTKEIAIHEVQFMIKRFFWIRISIEFQWIDLFSSQKMNDSIHISNWSNYFCYASQVLFLLFLFTY